jgi:hypothetical protein
MITRYKKVRDFLKLAGYYAGGKSLSSGVTLSDMNYAAEVAHRKR